MGNLSTFFILVEVTLIVAITAFLINRPTTLIVEE